MIGRNQRNWVLPKKYEINYPNGKEVRILDQESLRIPFMHAEIKPTNF
jgi:hypothetical protein